MSWYINARVLMLDTAVPGDLGFRRGSWATSSSQTDMPNFSNPKLKSPPCVPFWNECRTARKGERVPHEPFLLLPNTLSCIQKYHINIKVQEIHTEKLCIDYILKCVFVVFIINVWYLYSGVSGDAERLMFLMKQYSCPNIY